MFEKFLNKKVYVRFLADGWAKGIVTGIDENFIEIDNKSFIVKKYITQIYFA